MRSKMKAILERPLKMRIPRPKILLKKLKLKKLKMSKKVKRS